MTPPVSRAAVGGYVPYYEDDLVTLYLGDVLEVLPSVRADTVVTSPPYNTLGSRVAAAGSGKMTGDRWLAKVQSRGYADDMDERSYWTWQAAVADALAGSVGPGGSLFYNHKLRYRDGAPIVPLDFIRDWSAWSLRQEIVWARDGAIAFNARMFPPSDERVYWLVRTGGGHKWNQEATRWTSVWSIRQEIGADGHPCPFPAALPSRCIVATTDPGDTVLDPFAGSGTTLFAAKALGRRAVGIEIEEAYCEVAPTLAGSPRPGSARVTPDPKPDLTRTAAHGEPRSPGQESPRCSKCGASDIYTRWHPNVLECGWWGREIRRGRDAEFSGEHLHRTCRYCGWEWGSRALAAGPQAASGLGDTFNGEPK